MRFSVFFISTIVFVASATPLYHNVAVPLPLSLPSLGYQATSTQEFGGRIQLAGNAAATLQTATVTMVNWALGSSFQAVGTSPGFIVPLTLNLYNVGAADAVGSLITSVTVSATIQWRPETSPGCNGGWRAPDNKCYGGFAQNVPFALGGVNVPVELIYGLAFNTPQHGYNPTGGSGPTQSLSFGLNTLSRSAGSNPIPGTFYWNTSNAAKYSDGGAGGVNTFRMDTGWAPFSGAVCLDDGDGCPSAAAAPEPGTYALMGAGMGLLVLVRRRK